MWKVPLFEPNFDSRETVASSRVVADGWLTMGKRIQHFETSFAEFQGRGGDCVAVSSGTAALHLALLALGIAPGDEVIIPALTFVADANVVKIIGATPVLADSVSLANWNTSADTLVARITDKTRAIIVVHYAGYPCEMGAIAELCRERNIALIEDVAHAPGASLDGQRCGTFGDIGCFSFFSNKNLSIGEGGMAATHNPEVAQRLRYLRSHGMTTLTLDRHEGRAVTYDVVMPGLNYRMDEIRAAIGAVQLEKLLDGNARRKLLTEQYRSNFSGSEISIPFFDIRLGLESAYHILPVLLPSGCDRMGVMAHLKSKAIQSSIHYPPFWNFSGYQDQFDSSETPVAAEIMARELTLPLYPGLGEEDVDYVTESLLEVVG